MPEITVTIPEFIRRQTRTYDSLPADLVTALAAINELIPPTGTLVPTVRSTSPGDGWLLCDGSAVSKTDYPTLYAELQGNVAETANTFNLPDLRNFIPMGSTAVGGILATAGALQTTLTVAQLPAHDHTVTDPGHTHVFTGDPHTHTVTDPGHTHTGGTTGGAGTGAAGAVVTTAGSTDAAVTGITIDAETVTGTNAASTTGLTVDSTGNGDPVDILPPVIGVNWLVRT